MALITLTNKDTGQPILVNPSLIEAAEARVNLGESGTEVYMMGADPEEPYYILESPEAIRNLSNLALMEKFIMIGKELVRVQAIDRVKHSPEGTRVYIGDYYLTTDKTVEEIYKMIKEA